MKDYHVIDPAAAASASGPSHDLGGYCWCQPLVSSVPEGIVVNHWPTPGRNLSPICGADAPGSVAAGVAHTCVLRAGHDGEHDW